MKNNAPNINNVNQSQALTASQRQQHIVNYVGGIGILNTPDLQLLNKRQISRENDTNNSRLLKQSQQHPNSKHSNQSAGQVDESPYIRSCSNVTHMPDVVTKVTQNSMSFTAE